MKNKLSIVLFSIITLVVFGLTANLAYSAVTSKLVNKDSGYTENFTFFTATTTTATSTNTLDTNGFKIAGAKHVTLYFSRGGATSANTGTSTFSIQITPDGANWYDYKTLRQNLASSTYPTTISSVAIEAATSTTIVQMENLGFYAIRAIVNETINGEHTAKASAEF